MENNSFSMGGFTYGVVIDYSRDCITFVGSNGKESNSAFGQGSLVFSDSEMMLQRFSFMIALTRRNMIRNDQLIPMIGIYCSYSLDFNSVIQHIFQN